METLTFFNINFNNDKKTFLSLANRCINDVAILDKFDANEVSIFSFENVLLVAECSL